MSFETEYGALRYRVALTEATHVHCFRLSGMDAYDALDAILPREIRMIDSQARQTLLLHENGTIFAEVLVAVDDDAWLLFVEGPTSDALRSYLETHIPPGLDVVVEDLEHTHALLSLNGPYAWELMVELVGSEVLGVPYLSTFHDDDWLAVRAGRTGEFGYDLLVPRERLDAVIAQIEAVGAPLGLTRVGLDAIDQCALENCFFNVRREGSAGLTPIELQQQWRISYRKSYVGREAIDRHREADQQARLVWFVSSGAPEIGVPVLLGERPVGTVLNAGFSPALEMQVGIALLDLHFAQPGIDAYTVALRGGRCPIRTVSPPVVYNRSLHLKPGHHSYLTRASDTFPPIV